MPAGGQADVEQRVDADRALVAAAQAGDADAVEALVRRHQARIFNFALALTANGADAEDLAQETFIRAFRGLRRFRGESSFRNWLYRIAANAARTRRGDQARRAPVWEARVEADALAERHLASPDPGVERTVMYRQALDRALASLPGQLRAAVVLRDVEGLEYREIAAALGIPMGTVMSRIFRARRLLRPMLAELREQSDRGDTEVSGAPAASAAGDRRQESAPYDGADSARRARRASAGAARGNGVPASGRRGCGATPRLMDAAHGAPRRERRGAMGSPQADAGGAGQRPV